MIRGWVLLSLSFYTIIVAAILHEWIVVAFLGGFELGILYAAFKLAQREGKLE